MLIYIDFEYNNSKEARRELVSVSWNEDDDTQRMWLYKDDKSKK